jgi:hypothetical protein
MKELEEQYHVDLKHLYLHLPQQADKKYLEDDKVVLLVFQDPEYMERLEESLTPDEIKYLRDFTMKIFKRFTTCGKLRKELEGEGRIFTPQDEADITDVKILKQMYTFIDKKGDGEHRTVRKYLRDY